MLVLRKELNDSRAEKGKLQERVVELDKEVTCMKAERENGSVRLFSKVKGPTRSQGGTSMVFHPGLKKAILRCLSKGIEATAIRKTLVYLVEEMDCTEPQIPSLPSINTWRANDLPAHLQSQLVKFVHDATTLTLTMDCSALKVIYENHFRRHLHLQDHKISGLGLVDNRQQYLLMDLCASNNSTSDELFTQIRRRLAESGLEDQIYAKTVDLVTG